MSKNSKVLIFFMISIIIIIISSVFYYLFHNDEYSETVGDEYKIFLDDGKIIKLEEIFGTIESPLDITSHTTFVKRINIYIDNKKIGEIDEDIFDFEDIAHISKEKNKVVITANSEIEEIKGENKLKYFEYIYTIDIRNEKLSSKLKEKTYSNSEILNLSDYYLFYHYQYNNTFITYFSSNNEITKYGLTTDNPFFIKLQNKYVQKTYNDIYILNLFLKENSISRKNLEAYRIDINPSYSKEMINQQVTSINNSFYFTLEVLYSTGETKVYLIEGQWNPENLSLSLTKCEKCYK